MNAQAYVDEPQSSNGIYDDGVNRQILDAIRQAALRLVNESGANSLAMIHAVGTETTGMLMHNAVGAQRQMQTLGAAAVTATCAKLLGLGYPSSPPPPPSPAPAPLKPGDLVNPFQPGPRQLPPALSLPAASPSIPNLDLQEIVLSAGTLNPVFSPAITQYTCSVPADPNGVTVTPTVADPAATILVGIEPALKIVASGQASDPLKVSIGTVVKVVAVSVDEAVLKIYYGIK